MIALTNDRMTEAATARAAAHSAQPSGVAAHELNPTGLGAARSLPFPAKMAAKRDTLPDGKAVFRLAGVASTTDQPYEMFDAFGAYRETVSRAAFAETLERNPDVAFLVNHRGVTMARTTNGTLTLRLGADGLESEAQLNAERQDVRDLVHAIEDGDITEMSFAFMLEEGEWSTDFRDFTITKLDIHRGDVSAVNYGANPYTSIAARSREILDDLDEMPVGVAREAMRRLGNRLDPERDSVATPNEGAEPVEPNPADERRGGSVAMFEAMLALGD